MLSENWWKIASTSFQIIFVTLYFWYKSQTTAGAIFGFIVEILFLLIIQITTSLAKKIDRNNVLGQLKSNIENSLVTFFRKNHVARRDLALIVLVILTAILLGEFFWGIFFENLWLISLRIAVFLLLVAISFFLSLELDDILSHSINIKNVRNLLKKYKLVATENHFDKSVAFLRDTSNPDPENCIKEAVCALEAGLESLTGESASQNFSDAVRRLQKGEGRNIPQPIADGMIKLHAYRGSGRGIAHAALEGNLVSIKEAELTLSLIATYLVYLCETYGNKEHR